SPSSPRRTRLAVVADAEMSGCAFDCGRRLAVRTNVDGSTPFPVVLLSVKRRLTVFGKFAQAAPSLPSHHANGDCGEATLATWVANVCGTGPPPFTQMVREISCAPAVYE